MLPIIESMFTRPSRIVVLAFLSILIGAEGGLLASGYRNTGIEIPWVVWMLAGCGLIAGEVHYTRDFTLFCFGVGALLVGLITALFGFHIWTQFIGFSAISTALLFSARNWLRTKMRSGPSDTELENIIGQLAIPLDDLPAFGFGKAELRGAAWDAHNATSIAIRRGQRCKVMKMNGLTLWIMPE
jgi:inner membrane protein